jgi:hypothetical protein
VSTMTKPICEDLVTRLNPEQPDFLDIGVLSADGATFTPVYAVGKSRPRESQLYDTAAAGLCSIRGADKADTFAPEPLPELQPVTPVVAVEVAPATPVEPVAETDSFQPPQIVGWGLVALVIGGAIASFFVTRKTRKEDPTPNERYSISLGDDDHGHG